MRILIVDDDEDSRVFLERALRSQKHDVMTAGNGAVALEKANQWLPELVVSDILMPEMNGFELCRRLKTDERLRNIPFIFYTATFVGQQDENLAMQLGASRFLIKPMENAEFFKVINEVIEERAANKLPAPDRPLAGMKELCQMEEESLTRKLDKKVQDLAKEREALRLSEERFRSLIQNSSDIITVLDAKGVLTYASPSALRITGYEREGLLGTSAFDAIHPDDRAGVLAAFESVLHDKTRTATAEFRFRRADGSWVYFETIGSNQLDNPAIKGMLVTSRDITERKLAEEQLLNIAKGVSAEIGEAFFRSLVDHMVKALNVDYAYVGEVSGEDSGRIRVIAAHAGGRLKEGDSYSLSGTPCENIIGKNLCTYPRGVQQMFPGDTELAKLGIEAYSGAPLFDSSGRPIGLLVVLNRQPLKDIVRIESMLKIFAARSSAELERSNAEQERGRLILELRELVKTVSRTQKEWQDTFDSITDMISIHDKNFTVIKANKAFLAYLGLSSQDVINKKCYALIHSASSPVLGCPHQKTIQDKIPVSEEVLDENSRKIFHVTTYPYFSPDGDIIGSIHIARDITEEKETEMRMIMAERLASLGQMAAGIAHEINNPLESVMICAEMLLVKVSKDSYDHAQFEKYLKIIDEEVQRCRDITGSMLSFSRQTAEEKQDVDAHLLLDKAVDLVGYQGRLKNVQVIKQYGGKINVRANEGELRQVFLVLIINALDAMENKGILTIETGAQDNAAWIKITDTGPGIPAENVLKIFQPFYTTKAATGGTGLGLSLAHRIIANHQGSIKVSSAPGRGASFMVTLPL